MIIEELEKKKQLLLYQWIEIEKRGQQLPQKNIIYGINTSNISFNSLIFNRLDLEEKHRKFEILNVKHISITL